MFITHQKSTMLRMQSFMFCSMHSYAIYTSNAAGHRLPYIRRGIRRSVIAAPDPGLSLERGYGLYVSNKRTPLQVATYTYVSAGIRSLGQLAAQIIMVI